MHSKKILFTSIIGLPLTILQVHAIIFGSIAYKNYDEIKKRGGLSSKEEKIDFHRKFSNIGLYPFTILPSILHGLNDIYFVNGVPKIITNKKYIDEMKELLEEELE